MKDFLINFFGALMLEFFVVFCFAIVAIPILFISALFQKTTQQRNRFLLLSGKVLLFSLFCFAVGFGSCVMLFDLDPPKYG